MTDVAGTTASKVPPITTSMTDVEDVMDMEVTVDLHRLRDLARLGLPPRLRGRVYRYLLGVRTADKSEEVTHQRGHEEAFQTILPPVGATLRLCPTSIDVLRQKKDNAKLHRVLAALSVTHGHQPDLLQRSLVYMTLPLETAMEEACDVYYAVCALMAVGTYHTIDRLRDACAQFETLLRETQHELSSFFYAINLPLTAWLPSWLSTLLARQLDLDDALRLWDIYIAELAFDRLDLHMYVCLAILDFHREGITEMQTAEDTLLYFLTKLPKMNVDDVVTHARNIREGVRTRDLL